MFDRVVDFLNYQKNCLSRTASTLSGYELGLRYASGYFRDKQVTPISVGQWVGTMQHLKRSTVKQYVTAFSLYCHFLMENGLLSANPCHGIRIRVDDLAQTQTLTDPQIEAILFAGENIRREGKHRHEMYTLILRLIAYTGARCSEVLGLTYSDINITAGTLCFRKTKNKHTRYVPIPPQCTKEINQIAVREVVRPDMLVFPSTKGTRMLPPAINRELQKRSRLAGIGEPVHTHMLRHSFITTLIREDAPLTKVGQLVGHTNFNSTLHYTHLTAQDLKPIMLKHPSTLKHISPKDSLKAIKEKIEALSKVDPRLRFEIHHNDGELKVRVSTHR
jgi:integrase/recombinase XerC